MNPNHIHLHLLKFKNIYFSIKVSVQTYSLQKLLPNLPTRVPDNPRNYHSLQGFPMCFVVVAHSEAWDDPVEFGSPGLVGLVVGVA